MEEKIKGFLDLVKERNGHEAEFIQAVEEVAETVIPYIVKHDIYHGKNILETHIINTFLVIEKSRGS